MFISRYSGDIANIAYNREKLYQGDLLHYMKIVFKAPNIHHRYHGLRHMLHVTWVCHQACKYYDRLGGLSKRGMRNLLIAALFHDYDHAGTSGDDSVNIAAAISGLKDNLLPEDVMYAQDIIRILRATQFPHADLGPTPQLEEQIIRDADMSQAFGATWVGDILTGYGAELGKTPIEMLKQQLQFLKGLSFCSDFGKIFYGTEAIEVKYLETQDLLAMLNA